MICKALEQESGDAGKSEEQVQGTGWASLRGSLFLPEVLEPESIGGGQRHRRLLQGWMQLFEQSLIVDESSKGLANVVVF